MHPLRSPTWQPSELQAQPSLPAAHRTELEPSGTVSHGGRLASAALSARSLWRSHTRNPATSGCGLFAAVQHPGIAHSAGGSVDLI
mmetsp:Transcript_12633/g.41935  ORF Transcript_12633/g.41935 Transcript_12633/m.41935 type:complete len:86 (+) Transcript_12633:80-337(+)